MANSDSISLREHFEKMIDLRFAANQSATELAAAELSRRLELLNGSHKHLTEMQNKYITQETYNYGHRELLGRIVNLERLAWGITAIIAVLGFAIPIFIYWIR